MTYSDHIQKPISRKSTLIWIEPSTRLVAWALDSGSRYSKVVDFPVLSIEEDGVASTNVSSIANVNSDNEWFYDFESKTLYFQATGGVDPSEVFVAVTYRIAFSDTPVILPWSDTDSSEIEYLPLVTAEPRFSSGLDSDQIGVAVESSSRITMINDGDFWINYFDKFIWANKKVSVYSWSKDLPFSEKNIYFDGIVQDINYSDRTVSITMKDFLNVLRDQIPLNLYSQSDGQIPDSLIGKPKRRIYGRASGLLCRSLNQTLDGFTITGTISGSPGQSVITGTGTDFLNEATPEDNITISETEYKIESVDSATQVTVSEEISLGFTGVTASISPELQTIRTGRNTSYFVCDHTMRSPATTVTEVAQLNRIKVASVAEIFAGDTVTIDGVSRVVKRISGTTLVLTQTLNTAPAISSAVTKNPIQDIFVNKKQLLVDRDYSVTNSASGSKITLDPLAEFNITASVKYSSISFTNSSNSVTGAGIDFKTELKPRDWIKPNDVTYGTWYEILEIVDETTLTLRSTFTDATITDSALARKITPITDESKLTCNVLGKTKDGTSSGVLIKTPAEVVEDLLTEAGLSSRLNTDSFASATEKADFLVSMPIPLSVGGRSPIMRDIINECNTSCFGSLFTDNAFDISYDVLTPDKTESITANTVRDDDVIGWSINTTSKDIISKVEGRYRYEDSDRFSGESGSSLVEHSSDIVAKLVGVARTDEISLRLYDESDAQMITERKQFFNEISRATITLDAKLNLDLKPINTIVLVELDRLYKRFGASSDKRKMFLVNKVDKSPSGVKLTLSDLGNVFNRAGAIMDDASNEFASATDDEKLVGGFITDTNGMISNAEDTWQINLIT